MLDVCRYFGDSEEWKVQRFPRDVEGVGECELWQSFANVFAGLEGPAFDLWHFA